MNYVIEKYGTNRKKWLKSRGIGGTDLAAIVNFVGRWENIVDVYDRFKNPELIENKDSKAMQNGRLAEEHIKSLFLIANPQYKRYSPKNSLWLIRRKDYPEMTLSPDTLIKLGKDKGFIEIKFKDIYSESEIEPYLTELKVYEPQYHWQCIDYFVDMDDCKFGILVVAFNLQTKNEEKGTWESDKIIINSLTMSRASVQEDIDLAENKVVDFVVNNLRKNIRPTTVLKNSKKEKIEWSKLSNIKILRK